ncbi:MAG: hypothetical protein PVI06_16050 [Desulfobacterales bacterium]|jgi:hypothetical protein
MKISRPVRIKRTYTQTVVTTPEKVFHLLCPVREVDWVKDWDPELVISESGYVEKDCVFIMPDRPQNSIWVVTEWNPEEYYVEFLKVTPGFSVGYIEIRLREAEGNRTHARISYEYTALSKAGEDFVANFTQESYDAFMKEWELALNHYLVNGKKKGATKR